MELKYTQLESQLETARPAWLRQIDVQGQDEGKGEKVPSLK